LRAVSLSGNKLVAPTAMRELWFLTTAMLRLSDDSPAIRSHLLSLTPSAAIAVPKFFGELGLLQQWFPQLQEMCIESPQELLDIQNIVKMWLSGRSAAVMIQNQYTVPV
ncbi:hypothetical protein FRC09_016096, partial [Ceratobasidium sp. 395]